ncbi:MAG: hypothetical protein KC561_00325, partial [Myxococcales bacterium]|nr:hypothetical protein [Myxococcales bacterium]
MAEGIAIRFQRDASTQRPMIMYLLDRLGECSVCGRTVIERHYAQVSYHHLTAARFRQLAESAPEGFSAQCEQCNEPLGAASVRRWMMSYGFPVMNGLIQAMGRRTEEQVEVQYALLPFRIFDPQMQPEFDVEQDQSVRIVGGLNEGDVHEVFGRFLSLKAGWRRLLHEFRGSPPSSAQVRTLSPGCAAVIAASAADAKSAAEGLSFERPIIFSLDDDMAGLLDDGSPSWAPSGYAEGGLVALGVADVGVMVGYARDALARLPAELSPRFGSGRLEVE